MAFEHLTWAAKSDVGRKRRNNEDSVVGLPERGIFCVADGMGGMSAGDVASFLVVSTITKILDCDSEPATAGNRARRVMEALNVANEKIREEAAERGISGTGSTVVVLAFDGRNPARAVVVHAGDSRCYRLRDGELTQITTDHSVAQAVGVDEKRLSAMFRGVVTRAVGTLDEVNAERTNVAVAPGDLFLVCSDGLNRMLSDTAVLNILNDSADLSLQERADALVDAANEAGGDDNVTCLLVEVGAWKPEAVLPASEADETITDLAAETVADLDEEDDTPRMNRIKPARPKPRPRVASPRERKLFIAGLLALVVVVVIRWLFF